MLELRDLVEHYFVDEGSLGKYPNLVHFQDLENILQVNHEGYFYSFVTFEEQNHEEIQHAVKSFLFNAFGPQIFQQKAEMFYE